MSTDAVSPPAVERMRDLLLQASGLYRLRVWLTGGSISLSVRVISPSRLTVARGVAIQRGSILHCGGKAWCGYSGGIRLGMGVTVGPYCVIYGGGNVDIQDYVHLGPGVKIISQGGQHDHNRMTRRPTLAFNSISIGPGSWIGTGSVILGGSSIGRCVTVGPNSVVCGEIPDYAVVAGNPARVMLKNRSLFPEEPAVA